MPMTKSQLEHFYTRRQLRERGWSDEMIASQPMDGYCPVFGGHDRYLYFRQRIEEAEAREVVCPT